MHTYTLIHTRTHTYTDIYIFTFLYICIICIHTHIYTDTYRTGFFSDRIESFTYIFDVKNPHTQRDASGGENGLRGKCMYSVSLIACCGQNVGHILASATTRKFLSQFPAPLLNRWSSITIYQLVFLHGGLIFESGGSGDLCGQFPYRVGHMREAPCTGGEFLLIYRTTFPARFSRLSSTSNAVETGEKISYRSYFCGQFSNELLAEEAF